MRNDTTMTFRLPTEEKAAIEDEAARQQMSVGDWIRRQCVAGMADVARAKIFPRRPHEGVPKKRLKPPKSGVVEIVETKGWKRVDEEADAPD